MAVAMGMGYGSLAQYKNVMRNENKKKGFKVFCVSVSDPYMTLKITPGASKSEVKKAFRKLALQYHPDVCRGNNCGIQFQHINEAYDTVINKLRDEPSAVRIEMYEHFEFEDEPMRGVNGEDWDMWEEWMGWEEARIRDYSSHVNSYI